MVEAGTQEEADQVCSELAEDRQDDYSVVSLFRHRPDADLLVWTSGAANRLRSMVESLTAMGIDADVWRYFSYYR